MAQRRWYKGALLNSIVGVEPHGLHVPEAWSVEHLLCALDADSRLAIFRTCKAGRDWVLRHARNAAVQLLVQKNKGRQATSIQQAMRTRAQPISLTIVQEQQVANAAQLSAIVKALDDVGTHIQSLNVDLHAANDVTTSTSFLKALVKRTTNMQHLEVSNLNGLLPACDDLQQLTSLHLNTHGKQHQAIHASLDAYLTQLTSLHLTQPTTWPITTLFPPELQSPSLVQLHMPDVDLDNALVDMICSHTPALRVVTVAKVQLTEAVSQRTWPVEEVRHPEFSWTASQGLLPQPASGGRLRLHYLEEIETLVLPVITAQGLAPSMVTWVRCLSVSNFQGLSLEPDPSLTSDDHSHALSAALLQLEAVDAPQCTELQFGQGWDLDAPTTDASRQAAGALPPSIKRLSRAVTVLTDQALTAVVRGSGRLSVMSCSSLRLTAGTHSGTPWPWAELKFTSSIPVDLAQFSLLPDPGDEDRIVALGMFCTKVRLQLTLDQLRDSEYGCKLAKRLRRLSFRACDDQACTLEVRPPAAEGATLVTQQPSFLYELLYLARCLRSDSPIGDVVLDGEWSMTPPLVRELGGLPSLYGDQVVFGSHIKWSEAAGACLDIGQHMPGNYQYVTLSKWGPSVAQLTDICAGIAQMRKEQRGAGPVVHVYLDGYVAMAAAQKVAKGVRAKLRELHLCKHVRIE